VRRVPLLLCCSAKDPITVLVAPYLSLLHDIVGAGIGRSLIAAGMRPWMAISLALLSVVLFSLFICRSLEPVLGLLLRRSLGYFENKMLRARRSLAFVFVE
jgi:hypothetical protein